MREVKTMISGIILGVVGVLLLYYLLRTKKQTFSSIEKAIIAKLAEEEATALSDFQTGKEAIIAEYERLKLRAESLVSLKAKLPVSAIQSPPVPSPVVVPPTV